MGNATSQEREELIKKIHSIYECGKFEKEGKVNEVKGGEDIYKSLEELFNIYDSDSSGTLDGFEHNSILNDLCEYIYKKEGINEKVVPKPFLKNLIYDLLDANRDGKISKAEFFERFLKCLSLKKRA